MLRKREDETLNARQNATSARSAAARRDPETERTLYRLYQGFFRQAETERAWNVWNDVPWDDETGAAPSPALTEMVLRMYRDTLFLPDYCTRSLAILRSSRGRAWYVTRWSYDEGKHLLALHEWLLRRAGADDADLKVMTEQLLNDYRWEPPFDEGTELMVDALVWELSELEELAALREQAVVEGEVALLRAIGFLLADDVAHREFLREALLALAAADADEVRTAIHRVAQSHESKRLEHDLLAYLKLA